MKAAVLLATRDKALCDRVRQEMADLCTVQVSGTPATMYSTLAKKPFDVVLVDARFPHFDSLEFIHALRHLPRETLVVTWGRLDPVVYWTEPKTWDSVVLPRSMPSAIETLRARLDPAAARTIREVRYQPKEDTFFVAFRNRKTYEVPRKVIEADDGTPIVSEPQVIHGGDAFEVRQKSGNTYQVAWDFVLYHQEPSYPYYRATTERRALEVTHAQRIASRVRRARQARGLTLGELARQTGIHRPNLSRLETGAHLPSLETLERVADALGIRVADLVSA